MKLKYFSVIISIIGIAFLYFLSTLSQPVLIELSEIPEYENKRVIVEGIVKEHHVTSYASHIITIEDSNASTIVFVEEETEIEYGDEIQAIGTVQKYKGEWEIVVSSERFIKILEKWQNITFPLWQLAQNPTKYEGLNVNVTGYIDAVYVNYFYLTDTDGEYSIIVFYTPSENITIFPGQKVNIAAQFIFDKEDFRYKLVISEKLHGISRSDGE